MTSDQQRREVAAELRKLADAGCIRYAEEFYEELREIVTIDLDGSFEGVANSLADLIDRPTCEMRAEGEGFRCSACGEFHDMSGFDRFPWAYCPNCGAEVVDDD